MKILATITAFIFMTACGSNHKDSQTGEDVSNTSSKLSSVDSNALDVAANDLFVGAKLVDTKEDLPDCSKKNYRALIYVVESKEFYVCNSQESWTGVDLRGPQGEKGDQGNQGSQGIQGVSGQAGRDGRDGQSGINGKDIAVGANEWIHPVTGQKFFVGTPIKEDRLTIGSVLCASGSQLATDDEAMDAYKAGLTYKLGSYVDNTASFFLIGLREDGGVLNERILYMSPNNATSGASVLETTNRPNNIYKPLCVVD